LKLSWGTVSHHYHWVMRSHQRAWGRVTEVPEGLLWGLSNKPWANWISYEDPDRSCCTIQESRNRALVYNSSCGNRVEGTAPREAGRWNHNECGDCFVLGVREDLEQVLRVQVHEPRR
jgi:hypothetical protein